MIASSPWCKSIVAPRTARRPDGKARRLRISGIFERGATQPAGMHRRSNADGVAPRAAKAIATSAAVAHLLYAPVLAQRYSAADGKLRVALAQQPFSPKL